MTFNDASTGVYTDTLWSFGDGGSSSEADPVYTYTVPGSYTVTLMVSGLGGTDTETKPRYILAASDQVYLPLVVKNSE